MIFGQAPPPIEEDKVYMQPCFATQVGGALVGGGGFLDVARQ